MNKRILLSLLASSLGWAGGTGVSPVAGSSRPDAFARPGVSLPLTSLGLTTASAAQIPGGIRPRPPVPIPLSGGGKEPMTLTLPDLPPGRAVIEFKTTGGVVRREVDILPRLAAPAAQNVEPDRVQVLLNPSLSAGGIRDALLNLNALGIGRVIQSELLPAPSRSGAGSRVGPSAPSPCGGTLVEIALSGGVSVENALNALLAADPAASTLWYPDPISTPGLGAQQRPDPSLLLGQTRPARIPLGPAPRPVGTNVKVPSGTFNYTRSTPPVDPRQALGGDSGTFSGAGVTIAVLDTGYSAALDSRSELPALRLLPPMNALAAFNQTTTYTGYDDFWEGHGTQVAILAAGGQHGTAPHAQVLPIKVCADVNGRATCRTKDVLRGICFALNRAAPPQLVMNLSLGGAVPIDAIHATLRWGESQGAVVVAAGGNQGLSGNPREYPAAFTRTAGTQLGLDLLAVESVTPAAPPSSPTVKPAQMWAFSDFTTRGDYLTISAPGEALDIGHPYLYSGTSFAAPLVAGAAARVRGAALNGTGTVRAFMLDPSRTNALVQPGVRPMLNLSTY